jgi:hypothetical protein
MSKFKTAMQNLKLSLLKKFLIFSCNFEFCVLTFELK